MLNTSTKSETLKLDFFSYLKALFNLMKPRVMSLVIFTCVVGLLIAPIKVNFLNAIFSILAVALGSGAAGALNMWYEADLDSIISTQEKMMKRRGVIQQNEDKELLKKVFKMTRAERMKLKVKRGKIKI